jgi:TetR/AcrR family transcriptional regulator
MKNAMDAIVKAAMKLFAEKGYAGCSIREICQAAGVTKPVLYYHFQSKEQLFQELMLDIFSHTRRNLLRLEKSGGTIRDRLAQYVSLEYSDNSRDPDSVRLIFRMMFSPEEGYPYFNFVKEFQRERKIISDCIRSSDEDTFRKIDPEMTATALMGTMLIQILEFLFTGKPTLTQRNAQKLIDLHLPSSQSVSIPIGKQRGH